MNRYKVGIFYIPTLFYQNFYIFCKNMLKISIICDIIYVLVMKDKNIKYDSVHKSPAFIYY